MCPMSPDRPQRHLSRHQAYSRARPDWPPPSPDTSERPFFGRMSENGLKTCLLWIGGNPQRARLSKKVLGELGPRRDGAWEITRSRSAAFEIYPPKSPPQTG